MVDVVRRRDEVDHGVHDQGRKTCQGNIVEDRGKGVKCEHQDAAVEDTRQRSSHTCLGQDSTATERPGRGVGTNERSSKVGEGDRHELLRRNNSVAVESSKGLSNRDMLDNKDDDCRGEVRGKTRDELRVEGGRANPGEANGQLAQNAKPGRLSGEANMYQKADQGVEKNSKGQPQRAEHVPQASALGLAFGHMFASPLDQTEEYQRAHTNGSIQLDTRQALANIDKDVVSGALGVDASDAEQRGSLAQRDGNGSTGDKSRDGDVGNELDDPVEPKEAEEQKDTTGQECLCLGNLLTGELGAVLSNDLVASLADKKRDDGGGLGSVSVDKDERRVLRRCERTPMAMSFDVPKSQ